MSHTVFILATQGVAGSTLMTAMDLFAACNRIAQQINNNLDPLFNVSLVGAESRIQLSNQQWIECSLLLSELPEDANLLIPAPMIATGDELDEFLGNNVPALDWLRSAGEMHATRIDSPLLATHCAGVALLAEAALIDNYTVTTAWFLAREIKRRYPTIDVQAEHLLVQHNNLITGGATGAINDVVLAFVERFAGPHYSRLLAKYMLLDNQRLKQAPYAILSDIPVRDDVVRRSSQWLRKNLATDFCVDDIANAVGVSARTLIRRVRNSIDESPQSLTQKLRIEKSKVLLETTNLTLTDIVVRVGYSDESAFRRIFSRLVGQSPVEYRRRFKSR